MTKEELILNFIKQFRDLGSEDCFSKGMCYWFAHILKERFKDEDCHIMYDEVANHFGCEINGLIYDITGLAYAYNWTPWYKVAETDRLLMNRIHRDCRDKLPADLVVGGYCGHSYFDNWGVLICDRDNHPCGWNEMCIFEED